jgi:exodeoxyribonuclease VII large subunit
MVQLARSRIFADPGRLVRDRRAVVDQHAVRLVRLARTAVARAGERLAAGAGRLEAASPVQLLARGWSLTWRGDDRGRGLTSVAGIEPDTRLVTQLADGRLWSRVERIEFEPDLAHASRQDPVP